MHKGDSLRIDGAPYTILQVLPESFVKNDDGTKTYFDNYLIVSLWDAVTPFKVKRA